MRVVRVVGGLDPRIGGPVQSTLLSTLATVEAGAQVELVTGRADGRDDAVLRRLAEGGVVVHGFPVYGGRIGRRVAFSPGLAWWVARHARRFDVVHAHGAWTFTTLTALAAARVAHVPFVLTPHESLTTHDLLKGGPAARLVKRALRRAYLAATAAVVFSSLLERDDSGGRTPAGYVVAHPVAPSKPAANRRERVEGLRVGFLGRFDPKKNLELLFAALPERAELIIAGDGTPSVRSTMRAAAARAGVADRVTWLGFVDDERKRAFFDDVDVLAMPSRYECFGMAAAEALSAGVPVVVGPRTGIAALVEQYDCGFVVEPERGPLRRALESREALHEKAPRAASAAAELSPSTHGRALVDLYRSFRRGRP